MGAGPARGTNLNQTPNAGNWYVGVGAWEMSSMRERERAQTDR